MNLLRKNALLKLFSLVIFFLLPLAYFAYGQSNPELTKENAMPEAVQLFEQGREAFEMGRTDDASLFFDKAVQKDAQLAVAWLYKARTAQTDAGKKAGINKAVLLRNNAPQEVKIMIDIELANAENNSEKRFQLAKKLAELYPENARALLGLAAEYQNQGDINKFRDLAFDAILAEPESPLGYRALGASWVLNEPRDFSLAEKYIKKFVALRPNEASAHIALGDVYRASLNLEGAKSAYSKAIETDPKGTAALSKRGYIFTYMGMFDKARADFRKATELALYEQEYLNPNFNLSSYLSTENAKAAITDNAAGDEQQNRNRFPLDGKSDNCFFCCAVISMSYGLYTLPDESLNACNCLRHELDREAIVPDRNTIEANIAFMDGFRAIQRMDYEYAKQIIDEYSHTVSPEMKSQKNEAHNFLAGLIYLGQEKYEKALVNFKRSDSENIFVKYNMGLAYDKLGMFEEANKVFTDVANFKFANAGDAQLTKAAEAWLSSYANSNLAAK